ncbi:MAG: hypothetical protein PHV33_01775 [Elusimicrobiales bacterium]|nr:hypothetical protein [Elusimicrobiales bacterium]
MAKSLLKLLLLAGLSAGASGLPNLLGGLSKLPSGEVPGFALPAGKDESSRELRREMADLGSTMADLKQLAAGGAPVRAVAGLSDEERELMKDAAPQLKFRNNALTRQVGLAGGRAGAAALPQLPGAAGKVLGGLRNAKGPEFQSFSDFRGDILRFYHGHQAAMAYALWLIPAAAVALAFLLFLCKRYTLSMLLTGVLFSLSSALLWMLSASIALSGVLTKTSLLGVLPREVWLSPVVFLVVSAGLLRLADENYPFWNKAVSTLSAPIGASLLAAYWPAAAAYAKGLLGAAASGEA